MDAEEEGWEQTLCCVMSVINGVTNDAQILEISKGVQNFASLKCAREGEDGDGDGDGDEGHRLVVNGGMLEELEQFC